jgi:transposase
MAYLHFFGIDVSKDWIDVTLHGSKAKPIRLPNDAQGFAALAERWADVLPQALVVLEATGGYESALIAFLLQRHISVHRADPLTAKHFLRSLRLTAKTDALDAVALARYGAERHAGLSTCQPSQAAAAELQARLSRRQDLIAMRVAERNRLQHPRYSGLRQSLQAVLDVLDQQIDALETQIEGLIAQSQALTAKLTVLTAVKGVGRQTAYTLLAQMPELGTLTRRQAASLAGCPPHPRDSGKTKAYRSTTGGRATIKRALFMAAMAARRSNPTLKPFYERLVQNGKKPMVALTALMPKLITILNAKLREQINLTTW